MPSLHTIIHLIRSGFVFQIERRLMVELGIGEMDEGADSFLGNG